MSIRLICDKLLHPPLWVLLLVPLLSFSALIFVFEARLAPGLAVSLVYAMSAYSLTIWIVAVPRAVSAIRAVRSSNPLLRRIADSTFGKQYLHSLAFRGRVNVYQGMVMNFLYVIFRIAAGIRYASWWFLSIAIYYLVLGGLRAYLVFCFRHRSRNQEIRCYRQTARLLFLLNIPMGGMILLMIVTNSGYSYPGSILYLSALYTFYSITISILNLVKFRQVGSPILSAAKVLNFISAMMSILGLQTAMIAQFSASDERFRRMMNTITGGFVYITVLVLAVYMLRRAKKEVAPIEQIRK